MHARTSKAQVAAPEAHVPATRPAPSSDRDARKRDDAERRKQQRTRGALLKRIADLETRIADRESQIKEIETAMSSPGFYEDAVAAKAAVGRHQSLMWDVGDLMGQWEALQDHAGDPRPES